jgi:argininosuccinate lyase
MKKTLWDKSGKSSSTERDLIQNFTVGEDRDWDLYLARFDVLGSIAHTKMLAKVGLLTADEAANLTKGLNAIHTEIQQGKFLLQEGVEDVHSQVEMLLTERLGEVGKKIHMARSRNDQVLLDIKLYLRNELEDVVTSTTKLFELLMAQSEKYKNDLMPGYTHMQLAMPSSFGLWFGAYAESFIDDLLVLQSTFEVVNKNPLGSAAGFGSSFPIDRKLTTQLLGFSDLSYNVVYAQMGRGKVERLVASSLSNLADTLARMSMDVCLFLNQNFSFIEFPDDLTTGSSIMPHKKNPDVFELIRARCNRLKALPNEIMLMTSNLPSGYHRDLQLLKEHLFPAFAELKQCMAMAEMMLAQIKVKKDLLNSPQYQYLFSVEEVNRLVLQGIPFRDAYRQVGETIEAGKFKVTTTTLKHTHEGSIGNLSHADVHARMNKVKGMFSFALIKSAFQDLLK